MAGEPSAYPRVEDEYPGTAVLAAAIATFAFPVISLIAALVLMSGRRSERKRGQLRLWAWASAGWIVLQALVFFVLVAAVFSSGGASEPVIVP